MSEIREKLQAILAWAAGADPTDTVLRLSSVDYEAGLNWRNIAVLKMDDVRGLLAELEAAEAVRAERDRLREALARLANQAEMTDDYGETQHSSLRRACKMAREALGEDNEAN